MREPEITTVTLQRIRWPLTETDLRALVIAALGDRVGATIAEEAARSDGAFHWQVEDGRVVGAQIDLTVESQFAPPVAILEAEPVEVTSFRRTRAEAPEAIDAEAILAEAEAKEPMTSGDAALDRHLDQLRQPSGWPPEKDIELLACALDGNGTDDCAVMFGRPPEWIKGRFEQLTAKRAFPRKDVYAALAARLGVAVE